MDVFKHNIEKEIPRTTTEVYIHGIVSILCKHFRGSFGRFSDTDGEMNVTNEIVAQIYERNNSCWLSSMQQLYRENVSVVFSRRDNRYKQNMKFLSEEVENNSSFKSSIL